jgi:hypothetical protein
MAHPKYLREKACELRVWVRDIPIPRSRQHVGQRRGTHRMQVNYRRLRDEAYEEGRRSFSALTRDPTFRDFVNLYIGEGSWRDWDCGALDSPVLLEWRQLLGSVPRGPGSRGTTGVLGRAPPGFPE